MLRMRFFLGFGLVTTVFAGCISVHVDRADVDEEIEISSRSTGFVNMSTHANGEERPAVLYVPADYDPDEEYPLIVFLHGAGERGDDGLRQTDVGIGPAIRKNPDRFPCLVFIPQCPTGKWWGAVPGRSSDDSSGPHITDGINAVIRNFNVDEDRISLTGLSMGGYGTFAYGTGEAERFSAFMPICGGGDIAGAASLARRPMWVFHGEADSVVPITRSKEMVDAIREEGGFVKFTTYPDVGHNSWDAAYGKDEGAVEWLLAQKR